MIERTLSGDAILFAFKWWVPVLAILGGLAMAAFSVWYAKTRKSFRGAIGLIAGVFCAGLLGPSMWLDRLAVTPAGFKGQTGNWFAQKRFDVAFHDLRAIHIGRETYKAGVRPRTRTVLELLPAGAGPTERLEVNDMMQVAITDVLTNARNAGVKVTADE